VIVIFKRWYIKFVAFLAALVGLENVRLRGEMVHLFYFSIRQTSLNSDEHSCNTLKNIGQYLFTDQHSTPSHKTKQLGLSNFDNSAAFSALEVLNFRFQVWFSYFIYIELNLKILTKNYNPIFKTLLGILWTHIFPIYYFIRYKSPPTENPFGLVYRLDKYFSAIVLSRTLHPGKIYSGKIIKKIF